MKTVAFVPIKLNSERLPNKNILLLGSKPLCYYIFETLLNVDTIDEVYVYCSDESITNYIPKGVKFLKRDAKLDGNLVKGIEIYESFLNDVTSDIYILAHATAPFLKSESVRDALEKVQTGDYDSAFSAERIQTFAWYKKEPINYSLYDIPRTQDLEPIYVETSGFFIFKDEIFRKDKRRIGYTPYIKEINKIEATDIDMPEDFEFAKLIISKMI